MTARLFVRLLLAFALAFAGSTAQLHALSHAQSDLAAAGGQAGPKAPPLPKHSTDQCLVVHALDGTAAEAGTSLVSTETLHQAIPVADARSGESPAAAFQSRAPPLLA